MTTTACSNDRIVFRFVTPGRTMERLASPHAIADDDRFRFRPTTTILEFVEVAIHNDPRACRLPQSDPDFSRAQSRRNRRRSSRLYGRQSRGGPAERPAKNGWHVIEEQKHPFADRYVASVVGDDGGGQSTGSNVRHGCNCAIAQRAFSDARTLFHVSPGEAKYFTRGAGKAEWLDRRGHGFDYACWAVLPDPRQSAQPARRSPKRA